MKLLYGTTNQAKRNSMQRRIPDLGIELQSLAEIEGEIPEVEENGKTPLDNARLKAEAYYKAFRVPVFSCDSGLYFDDVPDEVQPGVHVRTVNGKSLTDEEMLEHYSQLARKYGPLKARYKNAICLIFDENERYESMDESLWGSYFQIVDTPHPRQHQPGFPLDRLSVHIGTGKYYYDLEGRDVDSSAVDIGYYEFFKKVLEARSK